MPFKPFKYFLIKQDGRSISVVNQIITTSGAKRELQYTPDGWQDISIAWERDLAKYMGLNRNFSLPLGFYFDGAFILRDAVFNKSIEEKIFLVIQQFFLNYTDTNFKFDYKYLYKGELDLSTFKNGRDRVTVEIKEGNLYKQFKANENTDFAFPFDSEAKDVILDGIPLDGEYNWVLPAGLGIGTAYVGMYQLPGESIIPGLALFTVNEVFDSSVPDVDNINYFAEARQDIPGIQITGTIKDLNQLGASGPLSILLYIWNNETQTLRDTIDLTPADPYPEHYDLVVNETIDLLKGDRLFLRRGSVFSESTWKLTGRSTHPVSACKFYKPLDAYRRLVEKVTGSKDNAQSNLLVANENIVLTCGDAIRGIEGAQITTKISDFFEDYNVTCFAGLSIDNGKIKIEDRATFFDTSDPIDLGYVKNHEQNFASDLIGSTLIVGHVKPNIEDLNGRFDPNGSSVFTLPYTRVSKKIEIIGPYRKAPYEVENYRINLDNKTTTDSDTDSECFVLHVKPVTETFAGVEGEFDGDKIITFPGMGPNSAPFSTAKGFYLFIVNVEFLFLIDNVEVSGSDLILEVRKVSPAAISLTNGFTGDIRFPYILDRTAIVDPAAEVGPAPDGIFNVIFTPKNMFYKHKSWLASLVMGLDLEKIKHQSGDKNTKFKCTVNGVVVDEDKDENCNALGPRLFYPIYHDIETLVPIELVDAFEANPNRCFKFTDIDTDEVFIGFNVKSALAPNELQPQQIKLLGGPLNDYSKLVY